MKSWYPPCSFVVFFWVEGQGRGEGLQGAARMRDAVLKTAFMARYPGALDVIENMGKVVDSLFDKAKALV